MRKDRYYAKKSYSAYMDFDSVCKKTKKEAVLHTGTVEKVQLRCDSGRKGYRLPKDASVLCLFGAFSHPFGKRFRENDEKRAPKMGFDCSQCVNPAKKSAFCTLDGFLRESVAIASSGNMFLCGTDFKSEVVSTLRCVKRCGTGGIPFDGLAFVRMNDVLRVGLPHLKGDSRRKPAF